MRILVDRAILEDRPRIAVVGQHIHRLLNAAPEEVDLQIERPAVHVLVEIADVGVVALLGVGFGVVTLGQNPGQRGLPASDIACNGYIHIIRYLFYILNTARPLRTAAGVLRNGASRHYAAAKRAVTSLTSRGTLFLPRARIHARKRPWPTTVSRCRSSVVRRLAS